MKSIFEIIANDIEIIDNGFNSGKFNMQFDIERLEQYKNKSAPAMFRLYAWEPWAVSLGFNQKEDDIDFAKCKEKNIEIVRRPTGGRAVLHAEEITYSIVCSIPKGYSPHDIYRDVHILLLEGLKKLNIPALEFSKSQPNFRKLYKREIRSISCFASSARWEIESNEKKLVGSAQRIFGDTLLQHGSILLNKGYDVLADIIATDDDENREALREWTLDHSISASEACSRVITYREASDAILSCFK